METTRGFDRMFAHGWLTLGPFVPIKSYRCGIAREWSDHPRHLRHDGSLNGILD